MIKYRWVLEIAGVLIILFLFRDGCNQRAQLTSDNTYINSLRNDSSAFSFTITSLGQQISEQRQIQLTSDKALQEALSKNTDLRNVNQQLQIQSDLALRNITIPYIHDTIYHVRIDTVTIACIPEGTSFSANNKWYSITGKVDTAGLKIDSIISYSKETISWGMKGRIPLFRKRMIELRQENPNIRLQSLRNLQLTEPPKPWYETKLFAATVGFITGILIVK